jgi:hypothetical protein
VARFEIEGSWTLSLNSIPYGRDLYTSSSTIALFDSGKRVCSRGVSRSLNSHSCRSHESREPPSSYPKGSKVNLSKLSTGARYGFGTETAEQAKPPWGHLGLDWNVLARIGDDKLLLGLGTYQLGRNTLQTPPYTLHLGEGFFPSWHALSTDWNRVVPAYGCILGWLCSPGPDFICTPSPRYIVL